MPGRRGQSGRHMRELGDGGGAVRRSGEAGRSPCAVDVVHLSGKDGQATMCWGGWCASQARPAGHHVHS